MIAAVAVVEENFDGLVPAAMDMIAASAAGLAEQHAVELVVAASFESAVAIDLADDDDESAHELAQTPENYWFAAIAGALDYTADSVNYIHNSDFDTEGSNSDTDSAGSADEMCAWVTWTVFETAAAAAAEFEANASVAAGSHWTAWKLDPVAVKLAVGGIDKMIST